MKFSIQLTESTVADLDFYATTDRRAIAEAIALLLTHDANVETKKRKRLRPNRLATWELRIGDYRVIYDFESENVVKVVAVGHKEHNDFHIRGRKVVDAGGCQPSSKIRTRLVQTLGTTAAMSERIGDLDRLR